ncbi:FUSC family protein [Commensalibacter melissae]|uniref:FUSC family protein n=1 Tax=Commensalibacter melissae TaxID=2070537 RepID=UPI0012D897A5|nr:FUSC family protein [Commensalibacter melissae]MUG08718.1 FUSC family protein [Commensalibacter melissae]
MRLSDFTLPSFSWLFAPQKTALIFALRTIIASYIVLVIALWMELDSPRWAIMAVWIVAQNSSRGEILSKAYWIITGNVIGIIMALVIAGCFPQQPFIFEISVAIWVSFCCWIGSCTRNFRALGMVMAGYSCAIVLYGAVDNLNNVFMLAMARGSYFILGILAENFTARLFDLNLHHQAHRKLTEDLQLSIEEAVKSVINMMNGDDWAVQRSDQFLASVISLNNNIEFREKEMQGTGHTGDHARAVLSSVLSLIIKASGLSILMKQTEGKNLQFSSILPLTQIYLQELLNHLKSGVSIDASLKALNSLRWECRQRIADSFYRVLKEKKISDDEYAEKTLNDRILYQGLREILAELEVTLKEFAKSRDMTLKDHFRFIVKNSYDFKRAWRNAIRAFVAITFGCIAWEITGWSYGPLFLAFLCMGCARFCIFENASLACKGWFKGACWAIFGGFIYNFLFLPIITSIEVLYFVLLIPFMIGGLAMAVPKYAAIASACMFFFCYMIGFTNVGRMDEITFFNDSMAIFMSGLFAFTAYRLVFPYKPRKLRFQLRQKLLHGMHHLANAIVVPLPREWISYVIEAFVVLMRQLDEDRNTTLVQTYRHGTMAVTLIGVNIIRLRAMAAHDIMTEDIKNILKVVLRRIAKFDGRHAKYGPHARTVVIAHRAISRFRERESHEKNLAIRIEISAAISSLIIISYALDKNGSFLRL